MLVPINITGASYKSRSLPLSAQVTRNFYPERLDNEAAKSQFVLHSFPGMTVFSVQSGTDRGMYELNDVLYKVTGTTLYSVDSAGASTSLGTIPGSGRCVFSAIGMNLVIVASGRVWIWNLTTLTEASDPSFESPNAAAYLNNQVIYDGDQGRFVTSDVGDGSSLDALNYATAESHPDNLVRPYVFNQTLYLMGDRTIETWYNSGVGNPPFDRIEGGIIPKGLASVHGVSNNDRFIYFLGDDSRVHRMVGATSEVVSTIAISHAIEGFSTISDAIGWCFGLEGQEFFFLTFPTDNKTFCYSEKAETWFELSSGVTAGKHIATSYAYAYRKNLIADDNNIYQWSLTDYSENGSVIQRTRDTAPLHGGLVGAPGKELEMNHFELIMETGTGIASGQGFDPVIMLSFSDDGGKTFSTEMWGQVGKMGEGIFKVEWSVLGAFFSRIIRVRTSDPVFYSIHSASADLEVGI